MIIGIDISQMVFERTGVSIYVRNIVTALIRKYPDHSYVLFGASFRRSSVFTEFVSTLRSSAPVRLVTVPIPPMFLDVLWNRLHVIPIEWFIGAIDIFWSSDWTQPPLSRARGMTTIHDLSILRYPQESHNRAEVYVRSGAISANIVATQRRRLARAVRACQAFLCDSEATKKDAHSLLRIPNDKLYVVYPGYEGVPL